jgi:hypothetical protein
LHPKNGLMRMVGETVRRERSPDSSGRKSRPETHPMAIEVGCFSVTKASFQEFRCGQQVSPGVPLPGGERKRLSSFVETRCSSA